MKQLDIFLGELSETKTIDGLADLFATQILSLGFSTYAYFNFGVSENGWVAHRHNYGMTWQERYLSEDYHIIDPVFEKGMKEALPFTWGCESEKGLSKPQIQMMHEAKDVGLANGLTIPSRSAQYKTSFISVASDEKSKGFKSAIKYNAFDLHVLSLHFDATFSELALPKSNIERLTVRERECLKWAKDGKTNSEISDILKISTKTVETHFTNIFNKFGVYSRTQAVVKAIMSGEVFL